MKKLFFLVAIMLTAGFLKAQSPAIIPAGFTRGSVTLPGGILVTGIIKEQIRNNASVIFIADADQKKKDYTGNELLAAEIDSSRFLCIKGDFFRIVCEGELYFLQKSSNAAGKPVYNGTEAMFINGTTGKVNDYFFYDCAQQQLKLLTKKNREAMIAGTFNNCTAAVAKAKESGADLAMLRQAVDIFNNRNGK